MGRKRKKVTKPWCWYCNREFEDEKILIQHQKAKHFKCHICGKKLFTGPGLAIHCMQVHKETIDKIPAALPGRDSTEIEVYGMEGIPANKDDEPKNKQIKSILPSSIPTPVGMPPIPGSMPFGIMPPPPFAMGIMPPPFAMNMVQSMGLPVQSVSIVPTPVMSNAISTSTMLSLQKLQQPTPMFPAYQDKGASILASNGKPSSSGSAIKFVDAPSSSNSKLLSSKTRIVCPDENVSLEERMAERFNSIHHYR